MCDVRDERSVTVCDVALERYRATLVPLLGEAVSFTHVDFKPTLVECQDPDRVSEFAGIVRGLMEPA